VGGRTITVTELDGRRIARLRVTASVPAQPGPAQPGQAQPGQAQPGQAQPAPAAPPSASPASTSGNGVSPGQVRLDSEAPRE
jgi:hypothetical protein